jgi:hypothetical protein
LNVKIGYKKNDQTATYNIDPCEDYLIGQWCRTDSLPFEVAGDVEPHDAGSYPSLVKWDDWDALKKQAFNQLQSGAYGWQIQDICYVPSWNLSHVNAVVWSVQ